MNEISINGISFFVEKKNGGGVRCRVGHPECPQAIYIPYAYFNDDLSLKYKADLTWILRKRDTQIKLNYYKIWSEGFELRNRLRCLEFPDSESVGDTIKRAVDLLGKILKSRGIEYQTTNEDELNAVVDSLKALDKHMGERFLYEHEVVKRTVDFINRQSYVVKD